MAHTPLQNLLEIGNLGPQVTAIAEGLVALVALLFAIAIRRRSLLVNAGSLVLLAVSLALDVLAIHSGGTSKWVGAFAVIFFYWAVVRVVVDLIFRPRPGGQYAKIPHDALMVLLWMLVLAIVFYADLNFDPMKLFASGALVSGGLVFALQEPLRNLATGVTFQVTQAVPARRLGPFPEPSGPGEGELKWATTEIVTRAYERIQIPNNMLVSQPVKNFRNTAIADEIEIGISYEDSPGSVKEAILKVVRDVAHVASDPPPKSMHGSSATTRSSTASAISSPTTGCRSPCATQSSAVSGTRCAATRSISRIRPRRSRCAGPRPGKEPTPSSRRKLSPICAGSIGCASFATRNSACSCRPSRSINSAWARFSCAKATPVIRST